MFTVFQRAFTSNLQTVTANSGEQKSLEARGIRHPTLQTYFAWRYSVMVFVVVSTVLSAGLSTYRDVFEDDERPDVFESILKHVSTDATAVLPAVMNAVNGNDADNGDEVTDETPLRANPSTKTDAEGSAKDGGKRHKSAFNQFADIVHLVALYILPVAAVAVILFWTSFATTFRIMVIAFAFSFFAPMLLSCCPWSWWETGEPVGTGLMSDMDKFQGPADGLIEGLTSLVTMLPTVISLLPGVQRACVRVKTLLPQSALPGWFLVATSPIYALFLLVIFVAVNQVFSDPLVIVGMLLIVSASLMYGFRSDVFTSSLSSDNDFRRLYTVQRTIGAMTLLAGGLMMTYLMTHDAMGIKLFGLNPKTAFIQPLDLVEFFLETIGRSMFMTVFVADLVMRFNLSDWKNSRQFAGTAEAEKYNLIMEAVDKTG